MKIAIDDHIINMDDVVEAGLYTEEYTSTQRFYLIMRSGDRLDYPSGDCTSSAEQKRAMECWEWIKSQCAATFSIKEASEKGGLD